MTASSSSPGAHTPVLIVGAGPVGLTAAVRLLEQGVEVRVIDEQSPETKHTHPVLLHARTLRVLEALGVTAPLEWRGRPVTHLAIYTDAQRRALLELPAASEVSLGAMTLPQDVLRHALMHRLAELGGAVEWKTRLVALEQSTDRVRVNLVHRERVEGAGPELKPEWMDVSAKTLDADFVIGADGRASNVRQLLDIGWHAQGPREVYVFYDAPDARAGDEAHLVLTGPFGSSVYPLQGEASRFSFEVSAAPLAGAGSPAAAAAAGGSHPVVPSGGRGLRVERQRRVSAGARRPLR